MPRRTRRYYRRTRPLKTVKYSNETYDTITEINLQPSSQANISLISAVDAQGTRKAKNFTLRFAYAGPHPLVFALVYLPQSQQVSNITMGNVQTPTSLYEPNQNVIISGFVTPAGNQVQTFRTRLARNLNSGDSIVLALKNPNTVNAATGQIGIILNYAISY